MICRQTSSLLLACPFYSLKTKLFVKNLNSPIANIRKMLLMKDRSFLYELRAYLIYVKVGEHCLFSGFFKTSALISSPIILSLIAELFKKKGTTEDETIHAFIQRRLNSKVS